MDTETLFTYLTLGAFFVLGVIWIRVWNLLVMITVVNTKTHRAKTHFVFLKGLRKLFVNMLYTEMGPSERIKELPDGAREKISFLRSDTRTGHPEERITLIKIKTHNNWRMDGVWQTIEDLDIEFPNKFIFEP